MIPLSSPFSRQTDLNRSVERVTADPTDAKIVEDIWRGIFKDRCLGPKYRDNITVEVEQGRAKLRGHTLKPWHSQLIFQIVDRNEDVVWVKNELVSDDVLQEQVIQALIADEITAPYIFTARVNFGWVQLGGLVPTREIAKAAEAVAGSVPGVRGILSLPSAFDVAMLLEEEMDPPRRTLQPPLGARVYQDSDPMQPVGVGRVSQVLIDPVNRLVSTIAIAAEGGPERGAERLVPIHDVEAVSDQRVWLKEGKTIDQYLPFGSKQFPFAPTNWRPPFPYLPGSVRWSI